MDSQTILNYRSPKPELWTGRAGEPKDSRIYQVVECVELTQLKHATYTLLGFACDEGVRRNQGRVGAKEGPDALRRALAKYPLHTQKTPSIIDAGNIICVGEDLESAQEALGKAVKKIRDMGSIPIILGGGHEVAWGTYQGWKEMDAGIINFDAHFDLRPLNADGKGSSGTPFTQIANDRKKQGKDFDYVCLGIQETGNSRALFETADQLGVTYALAEDFHSGNEDLVRNLILNILERRKYLVVTICLDVFAAAIAPGVSAPQVMGLQAWDVLNILRFLFQSGHVIALDIAEMNPSLDRDGVTAELGAQLINTLINR